MKLNPYLTFDGNALEAMTTYADILGGEITMSMRFGDMPNEAHWPGMNEDEMAHITVALPGGDALMASDGGGRAHQGFHGHNLQLAFQTAEEAQAKFAKLAEGGEVIMPCEPTFWAKAFGMCKDRYGVSWMVNCD